MGATVDAAATAAMQKIQATWTKAYQNVSEAQKDFKSGVDKTTAEFQKKLGEAQKIVAEVREKLGEHARRVAEIKRKLEYALKKAEEAAKAAKA